jgi:hypothetical protein
MDVQRLICQVAIAHAGLSDALQCRVLMNLGIYWRACKSILGRNWWNNPAAVRDTERVGIA